jgi:hypothetical protein
MANVIVKHNITGMGRDTENAAEFHTRFRFPKELCDFLTEKYVYSKAVEEAGPEFKKIISIPGVCYARNYSSDGDDYKLSVKKAKAFSWSEIEPKIIRLLEDRHMRMQFKASLNIKM